MDDKNLTIMIVLGLALAFEIVGAAMLMFVTFSPEFSTISTDTARVVASVALYVMLFPIIWAIVFIWILMKRL